jgi:hypothetical protein
MLVTEYFPMDLYRSMFFINTLDHDYNSMDDLPVFLTV